MIMRGRSHARGYRRWDALVSGVGIGSTEPGVSTSAWRRYGPVEEQIYREGGTKVVRTFKNASVMHELRGLQD